MGTRASQLLGLTNPWQALTVDLLLVVQSDREMAESISRELQRAHARKEDIFPVIDKLSLLRLEWD